MLAQRFLRALGICFLLAALPSCAASGPRLAPVLQPFVDSHTLAGAVVLVADAKGVLDLEAVGWRDIAAGKPMRTDSLFWVASQSKPIACTAIMILVDEGKLSVGQPTVAGATVVADVIEHIRGEKKIAWKMKRRKGYHRKVGHRQELTVVKVTEIKL